MLLLLILPMLSYSDSSNIDNNSPTFNSNPQTAMSNTQMSVQNNFDNVSIVGDVQCGNTSWSISAYDGFIETDNFNNDTQNYGVMMGLSGSIGEVYNKCKKALEHSKQIMEYRKDALRFDKLDKNIMLCLGMIEKGIIIDNQLKLMYPELQLCDHIGLVKKQSPNRYEAKLNEYNNMATVEPKPPKKRKLVGYNEYRIWFGNYTNCNKCGTDYTSIQQMLIESGVPKNQIYVYPFQNSNGNMRFSVNVKNNFYEYTDAINEKERLRILGFAGKVRGVNGSEIYK